MRLERIFFDCEFTGLHKDTSLISIGLATDFTDKYFYAEVIDYDETQVDDWLKENVINNLQFNNTNPFQETLGNYTAMKGTKLEVAKALEQWLAQFNKVELWSDVAHYDMTLFQDLFGGAFTVPDHIDYICYDIATVFKMFDLDPDMLREAFIDEPIQGIKHNALYDAKVIRAAYDKLRRNRKKYTVVL